MTACVVDAHLAVDLRRCADKEDGVAPAKILAVAFCASLAAISCGPGSGGNGASMPASQAVRTPRAECTLSWTWLRDPEVVGKKRGIDLSEQNYRVATCRESGDSLSEAEREQLAAALDTRYRRAPVEFERMWRYPEFQDTVTRELNAELGRKYIKAWEADLDEPAF